MVRQDSDIRLRLMLHVMSLLVCNEFDLVRENFDLQVKCSADLVPARLHARETREW